MYFVLIDFYVLGGSLGKYLCQTLPNINTEWSKWTIFFCDERYVPENDLESTFGYANFAQFTAKSSLSLSFQVLQSESLAKSATKRRTIRDHQHQ